MEGGWLLNARMMVGVTAAMHSTTTATGSSQNTGRACSVPGSSTMNCQSVEGRVFPLTGAIQLSAPLERVICSFGCGNQGRKASAMATLHNHQSRERTSRCPLPLLTAWLVSYALPVFMPRYLLFSAAGLVILLAVPLYWSSCHRRRCPGLAVRTSPCSWPGWKFFRR